MPDICKMKTEMEMNRYTFALQIKESGQNRFRSGLGQLWPEIVQILDAEQIGNFSIWQAADLVFGYYEANAEPKHRQLEAVLSELEDCFEWLAKPGNNMRLMYHDFGVVREDKSLIRHRMFMTKLKAGCEEEYKRRHDALVAARGEKVTPGPDSNFSIWHAGGYIFGYDEIDISMETKETPEAHQATVEWESKQLEIMDWITNDVDWLTGTWHPASVRLAWYK